MTSCFSARRSCARLPDQEAIARRQTTTWMTQMASISTAEDECPLRPAESWPRTSKRRKHHDRCDRGDDRKRSAHCPDHGQPQLGCHSSSDGRLCCGTVRSDLPRQTHLVAHRRSLERQNQASSVKPGEGASRRVRESAPVMGKQLRVKQLTALPQANVGMCRSC